MFMPSWGIFNTGILTSMIELIQPVLAPAVMISAGALVCLAQFTRFSSVVAQLRDLLRENRATLRAASNEQAEQREILLQYARSLERQADQMLVHAATLRHALLFLVAGVLLMVLCSLVIGATLVIESLATIAIALFVLGLVSILIGLYLVLSELRVSLEAIEFEHDNVGRLLRGTEQLSQVDTRIDG
jgi:uncharacterized protein DUF2721